MCSYREREGFARRAQKLIDEDRLSACPICASAGAPASSRRPPTTGRSSTSAAQATANRYSSLTATNRPARSISAIRSASGIATGPNSCHLVLNRMVNPDHLDLAILDQQVAGSRIAVERQPHAPRVGHDPVSDGANERAVDVPLEDGPCAELAVALRQLLIACLGHRSAPQISRRGVDEAHLIERGLGAAAAADRDAPRR
jgi:hypothetical protein